MGGETLFEPENGSESENGDTMTKGEPFTATFKLDKETRNTIRYAEEAEGQRPVVGMLYVQKAELKEPLRSRPPPISPQRRRPFLYRLGKHSRMTPGYELLYAACSEPKETFYEQEQRQRAVRRLAAAQSVAPRAAHLPRLHGGSTRGKHPDGG